MRIVQLLAWSILLSTAGCVMASQAADSAAAAGPDTRLPVPNELAQKAAEKMIREVLGPEYDAGTSADKLKLAGKLLAVARDTKDDPAAKFVLLNKARTLGLAEGGLTVVAEAVELLLASFKMDEFEERFAAAKACLASGRTCSAGLAELLCRLLDQAAAHGQYDRLALVVPLAQQAGKKNNGEPQFTGLKDKTAAIEALLGEWSKYQAALKVLRALPTDDAAKESAARFLCLMKDDWPAGLALLAKCGNELAGAAVQDQANPDTPAKQCALADLWWNAAEKQAGNPSEDLARKRAQYWYHLAVGGLTGLQKVKAEKRAEPASVSMPAPDNNNSPAPGSPNKNIEQAAQAALLGLYTDYVNAFEKCHAAFLHDEPITRKKCTQQIIDRFGRNVQTFDQLAYDAFLSAYAKDKADLVTPLLQKVRAAKDQFLRSYSNAIKNGAVEEKKAYYAARDYLEKAFPERADPPPHGQ